MIRLATLVVLTALMMLPALADESSGVEGSDERSTPASHRRVSPDGAKVGFVELQDGDSVPLTFSVHFSVNGMGIAHAGSDIENTGHHHLLIDVDGLPNPNLALPKSDNYLHFGGGQTEVTLTLPEGEHTLQLVFADFTHVPHHPVVKSEKITVQVSASTLQVPASEEKVVK